jgi:POT family proton-dependent oligopeptide transporter
VLTYALWGQEPRQPGQSIWDKARGKFTDAEVDAAKSVGPILGIFALIPVFWALFDQTFSTWVLQGERMTPYYLGTYKIGPEQMLSANPILVMIFLPIMTLIVYPMLGRFASPLRRMSYGMFLAGFSFVIVSMFQTRIDAGAQLSVLWQIAPYIVITMAEVLVSTTGLEFAFREAAPSMKSTIMGFWNLTGAFGNLFVTVVTWFAGSVLGAGESGNASVTPKIFLFYAGLTFVVAIFFSIIAAFYKYRDEAAARGQ